MKRLIIYQIGLVLLLLLSACSREEERLQTAETSCTASFSFSTQTGALQQPVQSGQLIRLFVGERKPEHGKEELHVCRVLEDVPAGHLKLEHLKPQWYKFVFFCVPRLEGRELFTEENPGEGTCDLNRMQVDYAPILALGAGSETPFRALPAGDLYRKVVSAWLQKETLAQENVMLTRVNGRLVLDMGVLTDQFEHPVDSICLRLDNLATRLYLTDNDRNAIKTDGHASVSFTTLPLNQSALPESQHTPHLMKVNLLPGVLSGKLQVYTSVNGQHPRVFTYPLLNSSGQPLSVQSNVQTVVRFNGIHTGDFDVKYAGFDNTRIAVDTDAWDGWQDTSVPGTSAGVQSALPAGQFRVSYAAADVSPTRTATAAPDSRISSLHYYVYDELTGSLIKKRRIRGINRQTLWPIGQRNQMSWELRQDLQDTLMIGPKYRILFIANADPSLFTLPGSQVHPDVIQYDDNYATARLTLPQVPLNDRTMYYLWEGSLQASDAQTVRRTDVLLQRVVTRTDVQRVAVTDPALHLFNALARSAYKALPVRSCIDAHLKSFCDRVQQKMTGNYREYALRLCNYLSTKSVHDKIEEAVKKKVLQDYVSRMLAGGRCASQLHTWLPATAGSVKLIYGAASRVQALGFDRIPRYDASLPSAREEEVELLPDGSFSVIGFRQADASSNIIDRLDFTHDTGSSVTTFSVSGTSWPLGEAMNRRYQVTCDPVHQVVIAQSAPKQAKGPSINFFDVLRGDPEWDTLSSFTLPGLKDSFFDNVRNNVFKFPLFQEAVYGADFNAFYFDTLDNELPDLGNASEVDQRTTLIPSFLR